MAGVLRTHVLLNTEGFQTFLVAHEAPRQADGGNT